MSVCGAWMPVKQTECAKPEGHAGGHRTAEGYARQLERTRKRRATETICDSAGCFGVAPVGRVQCPACERKSHAKRGAEQRGKETVCSAAGCSGIAPVGATQCRDCKRRSIANHRERKIGATYSYDVAADRERGSCYICGLPLGDDFEADHVVPRSGWPAFADSCEAEPASAVRAACKSCNRGIGGKGNKDLAVYMLARFRAGLSVRQAVDSHAS